ncbi:MAG: GMC family oxidoreductase [Planctomycetota bacterium]
MDADVIVIGSGFGGSVCALRAGEAGLRVVVFERGHPMDDAAYDRLAEGRLPLFQRRNQPGLIDLKLLPGLATVGGCAVGGGSHVYTGVTMRAPPEIFSSSWPRDLTVDAMQGLYDRVESMLRPAPIKVLPARTRRMQEIGERMGASATVLPLVMEPLQHGHGSSPTTLRCHVATWLRGGEGYRKRTLDTTYLAMAEASGVTTLTLHDAQQIKPIDGGYRVTFRRFENGEWLPGDLTARRVVLSAGTMNTVKLLLSCRDEHRTLPRLSASLGERFYTNGDFGAMVVGLKLGLEHDDGPPVTSWVDCWKSDRLFLMETGAFLGGRVWSIAVMGFDESAGRLSLDHRGKLHHTAGRDPTHFHEARVRRLHEFASAAGGKLLLPPASVTRFKPTTVHPLGGARMADYGDACVVDAHGEVHGYPGLFIADGSILPTPTGVPPSMTIAAVAEHVAEQLVRHA